jgi:hypothetical protein
MVARIAQVLILLQLASIGIAIVASIIEIEWIVVSGPLLSFTGLPIVFCCLLHGWRFGLLFAFAVPTVSIVCFSLIYGLSWSPDEASKPISLILFGFGIAAIPLAAFALREVRSGALNSPGSLQFRLSSLIVLTAVISIPLALYRSGPEMTVLGVIAAYFILLIAIAQSSRASQRKTKLTVMKSETAAEWSNTTEL